MSNKIVMCGCHESGYFTIKKILESGIKIDYFVLVPFEIAKKSNISGYVDFTPLAKQFEIPVYFVKSYSLKTDEDLVFFRRNSFGLLLQGGWQRLFPLEVLETLSIGAVGVHGSADFLPKGRGRSPLNWSLIEGKTRFIVHYFLIKPGVDDGDVFYYEMFDINEWDDIRTLYYKISYLSYKVYIQWLPKLINGQFTPIPQEGEPTYYPRRMMEDGKISWELDVIQLHNFIRALSKPYPGAFSFISNKRIIIWKGQPFDTRLDEPYDLNGQVVRIFGKNEFIIKTGGGLFLVTDYEFDGEIKEGSILE